MSKKKKKFTKTRAYRIIIITAVFGLIAASIFSWLPASKNVNQIFLWILVGVFIAAYVATILIVELRIAYNEGKIFNKKKTKTKK